MKRILYFLFKNYRPRLYSLNCSQELFWKEDQEMKVDPAVEVYKFLGPENTIL